MATSLTWIFPKFLDEKGYIRGLSSKHSDGRVWTREDRTPQKRKEVKVEMEAVERDECATAAIIFLKLWKRFLPDKIREIIKGYHIALSSGAVILKEQGLDKSVKRVEKVDPDSFTFTRVRNHMLKMVEYLIRAYECNDREDVMVIYDVVDNQKSDPFFLDNWENMSGLPTAVSKLCELEKNIRAIERAEPNALAVVDEAQAQPDPVTVNVHSGHNNNNDVVIPLAEEACSQLPEQKIEDRE
jgi:hypothetical protein